MKKWNEIVLENNGVSPIDGMNITKARKFIEKNIYPLIGGLYRDVYWAGPKKVWDKFSGLNLDWGQLSNKYGKSKEDPNGPNKYKEWRYEINFVDDKGKPKTMTGVLTAHGAGSVKDPLDAYDMTFSVY